MAKKAAKKKPLQLTVNRGKNSNIIIVELNDDLIMGFNLETMVCVIWPDRIKEQGFSVRSVLAEGK
jgi:hypothetical protein